MPIESSNEIQVWLLAAAALLAGVGGVAAWMLVHRARRLEEKLERLARLDDLARHVERLAAKDGELDLRRIEHVLIDVRDAHRRVEDRLLALVEARTGATAGGARATSVTDADPSGAVALAGDAGAAELSDRVVTRLLALGYERIVLVTPLSEIARIARDGGAIVIEARRDGAACKGRVRIDGGRIDDLQIQSAYSTFP